MGVQIFAAHIMGILNSESDLLKRLALCGDYTLKKDYYMNGLKFLQTIPKADLFVTQENQLCRRYCTLGRNINVVGY
jgi:hypothetical protein